MRTPPLSAVIHLIALSCGRITGANVLYADPYVSQIAFGTAIHWYSGSIVSLNNSHNAHPTRPILHTEGCNPATGRNNYDSASRCRIVRDT